MKTFSDTWQQSPHLAEVKLIYQTGTETSLKPVLCSPAETYNYLMSIWNKDKLELQEEFKVLLFNNAMRCLGWYNVSSGGKTSTIVEISHVLSAALLGNAHSIILAHNHPSGQLKASSADIKLTNRIYDGLKNIGITLHDHLIITRSDYYSFNDHNLIGKSSL